MAHSRFVVSMVVAVLAVLAGCESGGPPLGVLGGDSPLPTPVPVDSPEPAEGNSPAVLPTAGPVEAADPIPPSTLDVATTPTPTALPGNIVPIVDAHFHAHEDWDINELLQVMDELGVVRAAGGALRFDNQTGKDEPAIEFARQHPERFIPFAGQVSIRDFVIEEGRGAWDLKDESVLSYLDELEEEIRRGEWSGIGELFVKNTHTHPARDFLPTEYPADSPLMRELWRLSVTHNVPLAVHMEADALQVGQMERLLASDRRGTWLWAHTGYFAEPALLQGLFDKHPNLHVELSWRDSVRTSRLGIPVDRDGILKPEWKTLIESYRDRFVLGADVTVGSAYEYREVINYWRSILEQLSSDTAVMVAHRNADALLGWSSAP